MKDCLSRSRAATTRATRSAARECAWIVLAGAAVPEFEGKAGASEFIEGSSSLHHCMARICAALHALHSLHAWQCRPAGGGCNDAMHARMKSWIVTQDEIGNQSP